MTKRELDNFVRIGQLKPEPPAKAELAGPVRTPTAEDRIAVAADDPLDP